MSDRRRVLVFNHFAAPQGEAGGTRHVELFSRLGEPWEYLIIASDLNPQTGSRIDSSPGFLVVPVPEYASNGPRRVLNWLAYALRAFSLGCRQRDVSVVYGSSPHLFAAFAAWCISVLKRCPFVLEVRDMWPEILAEMGTLGRKSPIFVGLSALERFLYERASRIVVLAQGTEDQLVQRGIPKEKIAYVPNGPDPEDFTPSLSRSELRERFGFNRFTAVYAGAHGPANGLDFALDAAGELAGSEIDIVLVGGGIEKGRLMERAESEALDHVRFLEPVPKSSVPDLLAAADIGLHVLADVPLFHTSVSPNKVFDYMAAGLPVITNVPGVVSTLVETTGAGIAVPPHGIARGLRQAFSQTQAELLSQGERGRTYIVSNQSRSKMAARLADLLLCEIRRRQGRSAAA